MENDGDSCPFIREYTSTVCLNLSNDQYFRVLFLVPFYCFVSQDLWNVLIFSHVYPFMQILNLTLESILT